MITPNGITFSIYDLSFLQGIYRLLDFAATKSQLIGMLNAEGVCFFNTGSIVSSVSELVALLDL